MRETRFYELFFFVYIFLFFYFYDFLTIKTVNKMNNGSFIKFEINYIFISLSNELQIWGSTIPTRFNLIFIWMRKNR